MKKGIVQLIECINTWQGEGPDTGKRMLITRFKTCNRKCRWCDTYVKMRAFEEADYTLEKLQNVINTQKLGLMITGGEPTFHHNYEQTKLMLNELDYPIANVETNGYGLLQLINNIDPNKNVKYIYSPKIFSWDDFEQEKLNTSNFVEQENVYFKIVYEPNEVMESYLTYISTLDKVISNQRVYLMPEGITRADLLRNAPKVFDAAEKYKCCFSSRTHIMYEFI
jgi:7-carboxy-7-deazaguanine synthase